MNIEKIHRQILTSRLLLFTVIAVFIVLRLYPISNQWNDLSLWSCLLIQLGIALFLQQLNHIFNIIQERTFLPAIFYLLLVGSNPIFYSDLKGSLAALYFVLSCYFLFSSYQKPLSQINALNISLLLTIGSLLWTPFLFFFPVFWLGFYRFKCFNARVFFASLTGFVIVYLFIFTWSLYQGDMNIFISFLPKFDMPAVIHEPELTIYEWITYGFLLLIYLIVGINLFLFNISERVWTISILSYLYFTSLVIFVFLFLQSEYKSSWGLISAIPVTFLSAHYFSSSHKRIVYFLLLLFFLFFIGIGIAQHIGA
jgi:hypothetical protein